MITYQVEQWPELYKEVEPLWVPHYEEVGQNKDKMKLNVDIEKLNRFHALGQMHIVTARDSSRLIGYHMSIVDTLLHYKDVLAGVSDLYWIMQEYRSAKVGVGLFQAVEETLRQRGVKVVYDATKLYQDHDKLFTGLGYTAIERRYSKWIGG